jgi:hypothetical protein
VVFDVLDTTGVDLGRDSHIDVASADHAFQHRASPILELGLESALLSNLLVVPGRGI